MCKVESSVKALSMARRYMADMLSLMVLFVTAANDMLDQGPENQNPETYARKRC